MTGKETLWLVIFVGLIAFAIAFATFSGLQTHREVDKCTTAGGVMLKSLDGYVCADLKRIGTP